MTRVRWDHKHRSRMMAPRLKPEKFFRGWLNVGEHRLAIASLEEAAEKTSAEWFVELGVKHAGTSMTIVQVLNALGRSAQFLGVDLDPKARLYFRENLKPLKGCVEARIEIGPSQDSAGLVPDAGAAWILVDACHCGPCVSKDIEAWTPKVAPGGLMLFHDTDWHVQLRPASQCVSHSRAERVGVYDAVMGSPILRECFHLAAALEGGIDPTGHYWEGTMVWRRNP